MWGGGEGYNAKAQYFKYFRRHMCGVACALKTPETESVPRSDWELHQKTETKSIVIRHAAEAVAGSCGCKWRAGPEAILPRFPTPLSSI